MNPPPSNGPVPARIRVFAVALLIGSLGLGYCFIYQPVVEAERSGSLTYYLKAVVLSPMLFYAGLVMLFTDVRDGQIKQLGPDGKKHLTSKGWAFVVGLITVMGLTLGGWYLLLAHLGFKAFA